MPKQKSLLTHIVRNTTIQKNGRENIPLANDAMEPVGVPLVYQCTKRYLSLWSYMLVFNKSLNYHMELFSY